jgi:hypothetical protein
MDSAQHSTKHIERRLFIARHFNHLTDTCAQIKYPHILETSPYSSPKSLAVEQYVQHAECNIEGYYRTPSSQLVACAQLILQLIVCGYTGGSK